MHPVRAEQPLHSLVVHLRAQDHAVGPRGGPVLPVTPLTPLRVLSGTPIWWICGRSLRRFLCSLPLALTLRLKSFSI